jgi:hypothetical protein
LEVDNLSSKTDHSHDAICKDNDSSNVALNRWISLNTYDVVVEVSRSIQFCPVANRLYSLSGWLASHASNLTFAYKASQSEAKGDFFAAEKTSKLDAKLQRHITP